MFRAVLPVLQGWGGGGGMETLHGVVIGLVVAGLCVCRVALGLVRNLRYDDTEWDPY